MKYLEFEIPTLRQIPRFQDGKYEIIEQTSLGQIAVVCTSHIYIYMYAFCLLRVALVVVCATVCESHTLKSHIPKYAGIRYRIKGGPMPLPPPLGTSLS